MDHQNSSFSGSYDGLDRLVGTAGNGGIGSSIINYDGLGNVGKELDGKRIGQPLAEK